MNQWTPQIEYCDIMFTRSSCRRLTNPARSLVAGKRRAFHNRRCIMLQKEGKQSQEVESREGQKEQKEGSSSSSWSVPSLLSDNWMDPFGDPFFRPFNRPFAGFDVPSAFRQMMTPSPTSTISRYVAMDLKELPDRFELVAEVPGIDKSDIKIDFDSKRNLLTLSGETKQESEKREPEGAKDEEATFLSVERRYGSFYRSVRLPDEVNPDQIKASLDKGILTVKIPKMRPEQREKERRKISIE